jgi:hypothetical protein
LQERDLGGGATGMDGRTEQTEAARAQEELCLLPSLSLSLSLSGHG